MRRKSSAKTVPVEKCCNSHFIRLMTNTNNRTNVGEIMFVSNKNAIARKICNSYFLIDITDNYSGDRCVLYEVNETGMFLWENLSAKKTADELTTLLKEAIVDDVSYQIIFSDVMEFIHTLTDKNFILEVN